MGLDMYLRAEKYVSGLFGDEKEDFATLLGMFPDEAVQEAAKSVDFPSARVQFTVGYWRKVNQIHSWFVRECQDGVDECQVTYVSREKLKELREVCLRVLASGKDTRVAEELLAPQGGFFFGSVEYNQWYWEGLESTIEQLDRALALPSGWSLYYQSSW